MSCQGQSERPRDQADSSTLAGLSDKVEVNDTLIRSDQVAGSSQDSTWRVVSTYEFAWSELKAPFTFQLELPEGWNDPGDFLRLRIQLPDRREYVLADSDGLVKIEDVLNKSLLKGNLSSSPYLYFARDLRDGHGDPALLLFGYSYASSPGIVRILQLDSTGFPNVVFAEEYDIAAFVDLNNDHTEELVGKRAGEGELWGRCYESYSPFSVFELPRTGEGRAAYSLDLSKTYNELHYYGWAGPIYSESYVVVHCLPGKDKPVILKLEDAERALGK